MRRTFRMGSLPTRMIVTHPALNGRRWRPQMKKLALALALFVAAAATVPDVADAKRIGGGGSAGMQRSMPTRTPDAVPAKPAAPVAKAPPMSFPDERPAQYRGLQPGADAPLAATAGSTTPAAALAPIAAA